MAFDPNKPDIPLDPEALDDLVRVTAEHMAADIDSIARNLDRAANPPSQPHPMSDNDRWEMVRVAAKSAQNVANQRYWMNAKIGAFKDLRDAREKDARLNSTILDAWPEETVAKQLMYIGAALIGSAGVSATVAQLLLKANSFYSYIVSLAVGSAMFVVGLAILGIDQRQKWKFFGNRMRVFKAHDRFWALDR